MMKIFYWKNPEINNPNVLKDIHLWWWNPFPPYFFSSCSALPTPLVHQPVKDRYRPEGGGVGGQARLVDKGEGAGGVVSSTASVCAPAQGRAALVKRRNKNWAKFINPSSTSKAFTTSPNIFLAPIRIHKNGIYTLIHTFRINNGK